MAQAQQPPAKRRRQNDVVDNLKSILECPVCYKTPKKTKTFGVCTNGHMICDECLPKVPACPVCRAKFLKQCPAILRKVLSALPEMCPNNEHGCQETFHDENEMNRHKDKCEFRIVECTQVTCNETVTFGSILTHIEDDHGALLARNSGTYYFYFSISEDDFFLGANDWVPYYTHFDNNIFVINFCWYTEGDGELYSIMCFMLSGGKQDAENYIFETTIGNDMDKRYKIHYSGDVIPLDVPDEERYNHPGCFSFTSAMANRVKHPVTNEIKLKFVLRKL